ncbi:Phosphatidate cytidylyltransferase, partial [mine drainage metagenome]
DIAAYFAGSLWGKHKLSPRLSPKKSWEGLIAGFVVSSMVGALMIPPLLHRSLDFGLVVGAAGGILSVFGDLGESAIKRWAQTKDSGSFMPGHGGLLDRVDSLLFALPALYYLLR